MKNTFFNLSSLFLPDWEVMWSISRMIALESLSFWFVWTSLFMSNGVIVEALIFSNPKLLGVWLFTFLTASLRAFLFLIWLFFSDFLLIAIFSLAVRCGSICWISTSRGLLKKRNPVHIEAKTILRKLRPVFNFQRKLNIIKVWSFF